MAEITSDMFDIFHPTPAPLRDLSAIVTSLEIWRYEINKYRSSNTLKEFRPSGELISLRTVIRILIPDLPFVIYRMIDKYVKIFGQSMDIWLMRHSITVFHVHNDHQNSVLEHFEDFVCDYDGTIHYERTAKRMMQCDQFDVHQKFLIACTYCFEDDIIRIWPLELKKTDSLYKKYSENPQFEYWIDFLENNIKVTEPPIEELTFDKFMSRNRPSLEYFWNLIPSENRLRKAIDLFLTDLHSFIRFILPKLDDQQLIEFLRENGCELLYALLKQSCYDEKVIRSTWFYVKHAINEINFTNLIVKMIRSEVLGYVSSGFEQDDYNLALGKLFSRDSRDIEDFLQLCFEIWNTAAEDLKSSVVRDITSNNRLFNDIELLLYVVFPPSSREVKFLLAILSQATYEQRNAFWHNCWQYLINKTRLEDLDKIMRLCLRDEDEIIEFKKNIMTDNENALHFCCTLLTLTYFDELNRVVGFLLPEIQAARNFKQRILRLAFFNVRFCDFCIEILQKPKKLDEFINDAYNNVDQSADFKNTLMSSPLVLKRLSACALFVSIEQLVEFIDTFVSTERILLEVKTSVIDFLKNDAANFKHEVPKSSFTSLLSWCLEGNEEVSKFELSYL